MTSTVAKGTAQALPSLFSAMARPSVLSLIRRMEVRPFSEKQIALLQTFADQAVIAIENTRLFEETKEALDRQIATASILSVISGSPTNVDPVFEAILENASQLCGSQLGAIFRYDGMLLHIAATKNWSPEAVAGSAQSWPRPPDHRTTSGRAVLTKDVVIHEDTLADPAYDHDSVRRGGWRRMLGVPMLRESNVIGVIVVTWREPGPIEPKQIDLLKMFADQAVIAIDNTRLFEEVQARTRIWPRRWSSKPRPPKCCRSYRARRANWSPYSTPCWRTPCACAAPNSGRCIYAMATGSAQPPYTMRRRHSRGSEAAGSTLAPTHRLAERCEQNRQLRSRISRPDQPISRVNHLLSMPSNLPDTGPCSPCLSSKITS